MNIGEMQRKLATWAGQNKERKFYGLFDLLSDWDWLLLAHDYVAQNAGSVTTLLTHPHRTLAGERGKSFRA
jgi:hypothetical protein